jgi:hypothetical protein
LIEKYPPRAIAHGVRAVFTKALGGASMKPVFSAVIGRRSRFAGAGDFSGEASIVRRSS